jgi:hypothetical protein
LPKVKSIKRECVPWISNVISKNNTQQLFIINQKIVNWISIICTHWTLKKSHVELTISYLLRIYIFYIYTQPVIAVCWCWCGLYMNEYVCVYRWLWMILNIVIQESKIRNRFNVYLSVNQVISNLLTASWPNSRFYAINHHFRIGGKLLEVLIVQVSHHHQPSIFLSCF